MHFKVSVLPLSTIDFVQFLELHQMFALKYIWDKSTGSSQKIPVPNPKFGCTAEHVATVESIFAVAEWPKAHRGGPQKVVHLCHWFLTPEKVRQGR